MGISRAAQSPTSIHRSFKNTRFNRRDVNQVRTLWWWGKRNRGWLSSEQDDMEERLRRHQALMMHRYSKAMRRRSLWDRDDSPKHTAWRMRGCNWGRDMSSTQPRTAKVEDRDTTDRSKRQTWQEFHQNFESFKRAVDKAIERDPVGTLFGRRLRSPDTPNNSSWTSWSWIFDPKEIKEEPKLDPEGVQKKPAQAEADKVVSAPEKPSEARADAQQPGPSVLHSFTSNSTDYIYDPISGRKVPQSVPGAASSSHQKQDSEQARTVSQPPKPTPEVTQTSSTSPRPLTHATRSSIPDNGATQKQTPAATKGFFQTIFGEHGVDIPVKTYKPHKVYGYTGEVKAVPSAKKAVESLESARKRQFQELRLRTLGNNIDATNFNCEPWNNKEPELPSAEELLESAEKRVRTSPAPQENAPLFAGTTYASRSDDVSPTKSDWLAKEGFRARQRLTMPSLKNENVQPGPREPTIRMEPALDRAKASATEIPIKKFGSKLQPAMDRIVPPPKSEPTQSETIPLQAPPALKGLSTEDKKEDIDLLRASDVRAAVKAARVTKQEVADRKKQDRDTLEKDFEARQQAGEDPVDVGSKPAASAPGPSSMDKILKHIKQYPEGIVAKTMKNVGITTQGESVPSSEPGKTVAMTSATTKITDALPQSSATIKAPDAEARQLERLASDLNNIYKQSIPPEELKTRLRLAQAKSETDVKPKFSEPTVKPGVVRDLAVERHTKEFEPKIANIVDKAKSVKRELHDVRLGLGDVINERAITALANRDIILSEVKSATPIPSNAEIKRQQRPSATEPTSKPVAGTSSFDSPFVLLMYNRSIGDVEVTPLNNLMGQASANEIDSSPMAAIGSLNHPNAFVKHFVDLDKNGYELTSGGGDMLIFRKRQAKASTETRTASAPIASTAELRNTIAAAEAAAQPRPTPKKAANVLDELPTTIPAPGPAAPTTPTSSRPPRTPTHTLTSSSTVAGIPLSSISKPTSSTNPSTPPEAQPEQSARTRRSQPKVNRQEQVFSGQVRLLPQTTALPDPEHFQKQNPMSASASVSASAFDQSAYSYASSQHEQPYTSSSHSQPGPGLFARLRRGIRRVVLTAIAIGAGAYGIGVVAEGIGAKAQIADSSVGGPMKRVVFEDTSSREKQGQGQRQRQRAGIFSTESSR
ncbi:hypothetical protein LTR70_005667 [Exophiala xenobiotica]|uniref:Uncharacterized protein n=1 Tax=Lithohypha guttulata TaxID=1690604 RepID=A0ABR0K3N1_9EURO|nr:hypothetical protein LTR24_007265 [Lithohypha guttulata]KAK5317986.1 hypothetical protein LTR70_005667 [Exophiala xenobiotica]